MAYVLDLFSPETWSNFLASGAHTSGFSRNQETRARRTVKPDDIFLCYLVKLGRWCGALRVTSEAFIDETPIFRATDDKFIVRFKVEPIVTLQPEQSIPTALPEIWNRLAWTRDIEPGSVGWGAHFQQSLRVVPDDDAAFLLKRLKQQAASPHSFPLSAKDLRNLRAVTTVKTSAGAEVSVAIPDAEDEADESPGEQATPPEARESHRIQALLAELGAKMGFAVWIPRGDKEKIKSLVEPAAVEKFVDILPMNYNEATVRTIEQIDVLWLRGRSIARAFEVEHTTAIYSGLLRMADLVALQPDIDISLHIVAPASRSAAVLEQINRPVFSLLDVGPLNERCTLLTYDGVVEISQLPHVQHLRDNVVDEYAIATND
jgi:hypothetical protein